MPDSALFYTLASWFGFLLSAGFGNPIPEEIMLILGGIATASMVERYGVFRWLMLPACILGALGADLMLYALGRIFGARLMDSRTMLRLAPPDKRAHIHANFERYGIIIFVIGRLVPGIRTTLFLTAGTMRLRLVRFLIADGIGALVGGSLFFLLGYGLGAQFRELIEYWEGEIHPYRPLIFLVLLLAVVAYLAYNFFRRPIPTGDPEEMPLIGHQIAEHIHPRPLTPDDPAAATSGTAVLKDDAVARPEQQS